MSKKVKILVSVLVAAVLLTVGGVATVMAQEPALAPEVSSKSLLASRVGPQIELSKSFGYLGDNMTTGLLARVAGILDIPEEELTSAFKQARQEMKEEAFIRYLDRAVEKGRITQEEADAIKAWYEQKPEALDSGLLQRTRIFRAIRGGHMWGGSRGG